ncbi:hypothetical protein HK096_006978, partial [Nowakowskiella sp. JEL0078]
NGWLQSRLSPFYTRVAQHSFSPGLVQKVVLIVPSSNPPLIFTFRVYFDSLTCVQGNLTQVILSYDPRIPCPPAGTTSQAIASWPCEQKSKLSGSLSSEATECDTQPAGAVNDAPWFPVGATKLSASNYLSVITYTSTGPAIKIPCSVEGNTTAVDIKTYAANGNCYANEVGYYFKVVF